MATKRRGDSSDHEIRGLRKELRSAQAGYRAWRRVAKAGTEDLIACRSTLAAVEAKLMETQQTQFISRPQAEALADIRSLRDALDSATKDLVLANERIKKLQTVDVDALNRENEALGIKVQHLQDEAVVAALDMLSRESVATLIGQLVNVLRPESLP